MAAYGSSPLARGLRRPRPAAFPETRIIPARAGFTQCRQAGAGRTRDHPRSRGVYCLFTAFFSTNFGSSPLARGLRVRVVTDSDQVRIIPARAGFTWLRAQYRRGRWDHPRSRGVYTGYDEMRSVILGSSPLARGLRFPALRRMRPSRIIPARAGFTEISHYHHSR